MLIRALSPLSHKRGQAGSGIFLCLYGSILADAVKKHTQKEGHNMAKATDLQLVESEQVTVDTRAAMDSLRDAMLEALALPVDELSKAQSIKISLSWLPQIGIEITPKAF